MLGAWPGRTVIFADSPKRREPVEYVWTIAFAYLEERGSPQSNLPLIEQGSYLAIQHALRE